MPPDSAERRHSLPFQACPDRLTVKATPARPGCGKHLFLPRLHLVTYTAHMEFGNKTA